MKAPDKIYVHTSAHLGLLTLTTIPVGGPAEQEFIRKDALMEWAKEMKKICRGAEPIEKAYQTMIDKIESL